MKTIKIILIILFLLKICCSIEQAKFQEKKIDYSVKSNILNPDTLKGDKKLIFWHFVELTHKQAEEMKPLEVKEEFEKLGITTKERARFVKAYSFYDSMTNHKKSIENWQSFNDLVPKSDK